MIEALTIVLLALPYIWEIRDDRVKDTNKTEDVYIRIGIALLASGVGVLITKHSYLSLLFFSGAIHFLLFDYTIAAILGHRDWFVYLGEKSKIDNLPWWRRMNPYYRFGIRLGIFIIGLIWYTHG